MADFFAESNDVITDLFDWVKGWRASDIKMSVVAQPLATLLTGAAAIGAAMMALHNGNKTRENETERSLRDRFFKITETLSENSNYVKREAGVYALVALADDWANFHQNDDESAQREQQTCLNVITGQLRDEIPMDSNYAGASDTTQEDHAHEQLRQKADLLKFKHRIQEIITGKFVPFNKEKSGAWSHLELDLSGCHFHEIQFDRAVFHEKVRFDEAKFYAGSSFNETKFHVGSSFNEAQFHGETAFEESIFYKETSFDGVKFQLDASFNKAHFHASSPLDGAKFHGKAWLKGAHFHASSPLDGAKYLEGISLDSANFYVDSSFSETDFDKEVIFDQANFYGEAIFDESEFNEDASFFGANFHKDASFSQAQFRGQSLFAGVIFHKDASFSQAQFDGGASFLEAHFHQRVCFTGVPFNEYIEFAGVLFCGDIRLGKFNNGDFSKIFEAVHFKKDKKSVLESLSDQVPEDVLVEAGFSTPCQLSSRDGRTNVEYPGKTLWSSIRKSITNAGFDK